MEIRSAWICAPLVHMPVRPEMSCEQGGGEGGRTCIARSELLMPPSTASSDRACPLSFSIASRIALVWKHVASRVARAMWPFWVY